MSSYLVLVLETAVHSKQTKPPDKSTYIVSEFSKKLTLTTPRWS